jgi:formate hydrogenlyase subunit 4
MLNSLIHLIILLAMPPLLLGVIAKVKAYFAGRVGAPLLQPYYDVCKLFRKQTVTSKTTTWVFASGPVIGLVTALLAGLLVPMSRFGAPIAFSGDLVLLAYLLALGRFFTVAAALDTGSAFEGMGAAREATFACFAEPALFFGLLVLVRLSGSLSLSAMLPGALAHASPVAVASLVLVVATFCIVLLAENARLPFDDPNTHLELTMIHEVMVLDHSGPAFGAVLYGAAVKLFVFGALVVGIVAPVPTASAVLDWGVFLGGMLLLAALIGVVESVMARLRLVRIPTLLIASCLLAAFALLLIVRTP